MMTPGRRMKPKVFPHSTCDSAPATVMNALSPAAQARPSSAPSATRRLAVSRGAVAYGSVLARHGTTT
jgi:hypothetical protein